MIKHNLFVLGDSISIQYGPYLRGIIKEKFHYDRKRGVDLALEDLDKPVGANGGDSRRVLGYLKEEKGKGIIYDWLLLNCGLHDLRVYKDTHKHQVPIDEYERNLKEIISIAVAMSNRIIWVETTPIIDENHNSRPVEMLRYSKDVIAYNNVANKVMREKNISIISLHNFTKKFGSVAFYDHAHFTEEIRKLQAAYIAGFISAY